MLVFSHWLLPDRGKTGVGAMINNPREYTVALLVQGHSPVVGETVEEAGLRNLSGLFLVEVTRADGSVMPAVAPDTLILEGDTLLFAGVVDTVRELYHIQGLVPATGQSQKMKIERHRRRLNGQGIEVSVAVLRGHHRGSPTGRAREAENRGHPAESRRHAAGGGGGGVCAAVRKGLQLRAGVGGVAVAAAARRRGAHGDRGGDRGGHGGGGGQRGGAAGDGGQHGGGGDDRERVHERGQRRAGGGHGGGGDDRGQLRGVQRAGGQRGGRAHGGRAGGGVRARRHAGAAVRRVRGHGGAVVGDHEQRGGDAGVPGGAARGAAAARERGGGAVHADDRRVGVLRHAHRLPDQPDGARPGRLPRRRLAALRRAAAARAGRRGRARRARAAQLSDVGPLHSPRSERRPLHSLLSCAP
ncbi:Regulator of K+ conductance [Gracilaria domingensis]|nr:Regulator of K+ conductance [Gracilaria domingensis]